MGATVETTEGHAPLVVEGGAVRAIDYELPVASAQVKSAILLAGVQAEGRTTVVEPSPTRDHTERLLERAGARVTRRPTSVTVEPATELRLPELEIPGDISSSAPFLVAAAIVPGSSVTVHGTAPPGKATYPGRNRSNSRVRSMTSTSGPSPCRHARRSATNA